MGKTERRQELLRAARDVFAEKGYHDAKIDDIVSAAKVAKGTFYLYFRDKRSVFSELVDGLLGKLVTTIVTVDTAGDVGAQVQHNIRAIVAVLLDDPALTRLLLSYAGGVDPAFVTRVRMFYDKVKLLLQSSLEEGQRLGIVAPGDARLYATFTIGALKEILLEASAKEPSRGRESIVQALYGLLETGYLRIGAGGEVGALKESRPPQRASRARSSRRSG